MIPDLLVLLPLTAARAIRAGGSWGHFTVRVSDPENVGAVIALSTGDSTRTPVQLTPANHFLNSCDSRPAGRWYRVDADLHGAWMMLRTRAGTTLPSRVLAEAVSAGFSRGPHLAITYAPDVDERFPGVGVPDLLAWHISEDEASPVSIETEPDTLGTVQLEPGWPVADLARATVLLVGTGSIGGAAAVALAGYGIGRLLLLDPDRLLWHNLVRHVTDARDVGALKVTALARQLRALRPQTTVETFPLDVVTDAHQVRGLLERTDVVVCAADGVAPRRVVSHLARRAGVAAVLACVLEDGGLGEVLRLRPWAGHGCLLCQRQALTEAGAIDPEPALDAGYGTGTRHRPMTAVGADLHLVGQLAAKVAVSTLLQRRGHRAQQLPGEQALVGLRPPARRAPPFDLTGSGEIRWAPAWPVLSGCPTCEDP